MTDALLDEILLSLVEGVGSAIYRQLIERFGSASAILDASRSDLGGFKFYRKDTLEHLLSARKTHNARAVVDYCRQENICIVPFASAEYPAALKHLSDPPPLLYVKGQLLPRDTRSLAVIGTRYCTNYGARTTELLTAELVKHDFTIIAGLALGIDGVAHRTAVECKGRTIAVLGSGLGNIYPAEHLALAQEIIESGGAVMSELPPLHPPAEWTFPQRNRIVTGLTLGTLVTEAPLKSGAMISARLALEQNKDLFAVPGRIDSPVSAGCHHLLKNGAYLVETVQDILEVLKPLKLF